LPAPQKGAPNGAET